MSVKSLAESLILQSMEDLSDADNRAGSQEFFSGEGFRICAQMANMSSEEQVKVLEIVRKITSITAPLPKTEKVRLRAARRSVPALYA